MGVIEVINGHREPHIRLFVIKALFVLVLKMFNYALWFEVARVIILVPFSHKSREYGTPDKFMQC